MGKWFEYNMVSVVQVASLYCELSIAVIPGDIGY